MKNWKKNLSVLLTATFLSSTAHAGAIDALKKFNQDADGLSGSFTQTVQSKKKNQTSSGTFQILRPGLFKWDYKSPYKQTIVGDGANIWLYDVDLKQVTKSNQDQTIGDSPAAILSNKSALDSSYTLKEDGTSGDIQLRSCHAQTRQRRLPIHSHRLPRRQISRNAIKRRFWQSNIHSFQRCKH